MPAPKEQPPVPYLTHEADMMRADMMHRRLLWIIVLLIVALAATNITWLIVWQSYDFESYQIEQDGEGVNIIGNENAFNLGRLVTKMQVLVAQGKQEALWHKFVDVRNLLVCVINSRIVLGVVFQAGT